MGTLLYVLTTGKKPFEAPTDLELLMQVRKGRYDKPSEVVRDFNPDVERFIARALRTDRAKRWQSAEHMADRLDAVLAKLGQPNGPAVLKRWLETLSSRDGLLAPSEVAPASPQGSAGGPTGTIDLVSGDFQLTEPSDEDSGGTGWAATARARPGAAVAGPGDVRAGSAGARGGLGDNSKAAYEAVELSPAAPASSIATTSPPGSGAPDADSRAPAPAPRASEPPPPADDDARASAPGDASPRGDDTPARRPARARESVLGRWLRRATMTLFLSVGLVCGAYLARPYLPPWVVPPWLARSIEGWLDKLAAPTRGAPAPLE